MTASDRVRAFATATAALKQALQEARQARLVGNAADVCRTSERLRDLAPVVADLLAELTDAQVL